jgi:hypothetical protein
MPLFKSREQRRIERDVQVRQGIAQIQRQIKILEKNEKGYLAKARKAKQLGAEDQVAFLRQTLRRAMAGRMQMERQLLAIETAAQMKNQAESYSAFARSMTAVSQSIAEVFGATDLTKTQREFEKAMVQAQTMEQRMAVFLDMTTETMSSMEMTGGEDLVSDADLDRLLEADAAHEERVMDDDIAKSLREIEKELGRDK